MTLLEAMREIKDERDYCGRRHRLWSVLTLIVAGLMSGKTSLQEIARWGRRLTDKAKDMAGFYHDTPCAATLSNILRRLDAEMLGRHLQEWAKTFLGEDKAGHLALDGKTVCGTGRQPGEKRLHLLSLFSTALSQVYGQTPMQAGENEISAAVRFLATVDLTGKTVTGDAIFAQKKCVRPL